MLLDASRLRRIAGSERQRANDGSPNPSAESGVSVAPNGAAVSAPPHVDIGVELDVRGKRADEAVEALNAYLDAALAHGLSRVRVIHGKGTGALRNAVWRRLAASREVASYALAPRERGGEGATEVALR